MKGNGFSCLDFYNVVISIFTKEQIFWKTVYTLVSCGTNRKSKYVWNYDLRINSPSKKIMQHLLRRLHIFFSKYKYDATIGIYRAVRQMVHNINLDSNPRKSNTEMVQIKSKFSLYMSIKWM